MQCLVPTYKSLTYQITFRPAALLFLPSTHHPMLLLCRSRWPWLVNDHLVMLYVLNSHQVGHLPLSHPKDGGQLYLANMGIPKNVYKEVIFRTLEFILLKIMSGWYQVCLSLWRQVCDRFAPAKINYVVCRRHLCSLDKRQLWC